MTIRFGCFLSKHMTKISLYRSVAVPLVSTVPTRRQITTTLVKPLATGASMWESVNPQKVNIYTDYTVYKSRGAMTMKIIKPTWERVPSGSGLKIARDGTILLEFANARGEREYDWEGKETFALSAVECGELLERLEEPRADSIQFFHDPNKMGTSEGTINKVLRITPNPQRDAYYFGLSVNNKISNQVVKYDTVVTPAELRVIRTIMEFSIPRILGFDEMFAGAPDIREGMPSAPEQPPF